MNVYMESFDYSEFILNMIHEETNMRNFINSCILAGTPENLNESYSYTVLNEGKFIDKIKAIFNKIKTVIGGLFKKFAEKMDGVFKNDIEYLTKYKDIIIGKKCNLSSVKMKNHEEGMKRIKNVLDKQAEFAIVPSQDFWTKLDEIVKGIGTNGLSNVDAFPNTLRTKLITDLGINTESATTGIRVNDDTDYKDACTDYFNGSSDDVEYSGDQITTMMEHIYNSVYLWENTHKAINKLKTTYEQTLTKIENEFSTKLKDLATKPEATGQSSHNESYSYLSEADIVSKTDNSKNNVSDKAVQSANKQAAKATDSTTNTLKSTDASTATADAATTTAQSAKDTIATSTANNKPEVNINAIDNICTKYIQAYSGARTILLAGMMNGIKNMEVDYMQVIRAHVASYLGKPESTEDNTGKNKVTATTATNPAPVSVPV